jgi:hypothetical protein
MNKFDEQNSATASARRDGHPVQLRTELFDAQPQLQSTTEPWFRERTFELRVTVQKRFRFDSEV